MNSNEYKVNNSILKSLTPSEELRKSMAAIQASFVTSKDYLKTIESIRESFTPSEELQKSMAAIQASFATSKDYLKTIESIRESFTPSEELRNSIQAMRSYIGPLKLSSSVNTPLLTQAQRRELSRI